MQNKRKCAGRTRFGTGILIFIMLMPPLLWAQNGDGCRPCCQTAQAAMKADLAEAQVDYWTAIAFCQNITDPFDKRQCRLDAENGLLEAVSSVNATNQARLKICRLLGDQAYNPVVEPNNFVDFGDVIDRQAFTPNPYYPLTPGTVWEYMKFDSLGAAIETSRVEVLNQTTEIMDVNCIVVRDRVWEIDEGSETLVEDTLDFFAQDLEGNVWYFGENTWAFEAGELVSLEGSWRAGVDNALPGIVMLADPQPGDVYRQEFLIGEAEDVARVVSRGDAQVTVVFGTFTEDVLRVREWTPLEPDQTEIKFYAPNVGLILENSPQTGESVELIDLITP